MKKTHITIDLAPVSQVKPGDIEAVMKLMQIAYGDRWQGEDNFRANILANATELLRIYRDGALAASLLLDNERISIIAVNPDFQGQGLGVRLFQEAAKAHSDAWITAGTDADEMIITLTSDKLNYLPVEEKSRIEGLFRSTNQGRNHFRVEVENSEVPILSQRLTKKSVPHANTFMTYAREGATHSTTYHQIVFQNQPTVMG